MRYHNITKDDMLNGNGLRVVLWVSGCSHHCEGCQNPITWNPEDGLEFDEFAKQEIFDELEKDYVRGITFSGGDPLHPANREDVARLMLEIVAKYPHKDIWMYTGYTFEEILQDDFLKYIVLCLVDVLVEGRFEKDKMDINYHWAGSTNQRVIDIDKSVNEREIVLYEN